MEWTTEEGRGLEGSLAEGERMDDGGEDGGGRARGPCASSGHQETGHGSAESTVAADPWWVRSRVRTGWVPHVRSQFSSDPGRIPFRGGPGLSEPEEFQPQISCGVGPLQGCGSTGPRAKGHIRSNSVH